jgi:hypothetical protein
LCCLGVHSELKLPLNVNPSWIKTQFFAMGELDSTTRQKVEDYPQACSAGLVAASGPAPCGVFFS